MADPAENQHRPQGAAYVAPFHQSLQVILMSKNPAPLELITIIMGEVGERGLEGPRTKSAQTCFRNHLETHLGRKQPGVVLSELFVELSPPSHRVIHSGDDRDCRDDSNQSDGGDGELGEMEIFESPPI